MLRFDAKLNSRNQITIPEIVREKLGLLPGDTVSFLIEGSVISVERSKGTDFEPDQSRLEPEHQIIEAQ